jgi:hypothetical protein
MRADRSGLEWPSRCNKVERTIERGSTARRGSLHQSETSRPQPFSHERRNRPQLAPPTPSLLLQGLPGAALSLCKFGPAESAPWKKLGFGGGRIGVGAGFDSHTICFEICLCYSPRSLDLDGFDLLRYVCKICFSRVHHNMFGHMFGIHQNIPRFHAQHFRTRYVSRYDCVLVRIDLDGYRARKMKHWLCKTFRHLTYNRSRNPNTILRSHCLTGSSKHRLD